MPYGLDDYDDKNGFGELVVKLTRGVGEKWTLPGNANVKPAGKAAKP